MLHYEEFVILIAHQSKQNSSILGYQIEISGGFVIYSRLYQSFTEQMTSIIFHK